MRSLLYVTVIAIFHLFPCTNFQDVPPSNRIPLLKPVEASAADLHPLSLSTLYWFVRKGLTDADLRNDAASPADFLLSLLEDPDLSYLSDVKFIVGDSQRQFNAHRIILAGRSPIFKNVFSDGRTVTQAIMVNDMQPDVFSAVLRYIYSKTLPAKPDIKVLLGLIHGGQRYVIPSLVDASISMVTQSLTSANVIWVLEQASNLDQKDLLDKCWEVIRAQAKDIVESPEFDKVTLGFLRSLLMQDVLKELPEAVLFDRVINWAEQRVPPQPQSANQGPTQRSQTLRAFLEPLLYDFRFLSMTSQEFAKGPCGSGILTKEEQLEILLSIGNGDEGKTWKSKFSKRLRRSV